MMRQKTEVFSDDETEDRSVLVMMRQKCLVMMRQKTEVCLVMMRQKTEVFMMMSRSVSDDRQKTEVFSDDETEDRSV